MGNVLRSLKGGEDDHGGRDDHYPYYRPTSEPSVTRLQSACTAAVPNFEHLQWGSEVRFGKRVAVPRYQRKAGCSEYIDESSAEGLLDAASYANANAMLIQVPVLGTTKRFWRLSDEATRISRKLALILKSHHSVGKYLAAPLKVSNIWIGSVGSVKLTGVTFFTDEHLSTQHVRNDYRHLFGVLQYLICISGGDTTKLPPDYREFLVLLLSNTLTMKDEFLIVNNPALLPMSNRTEVFLMLYDRITKYLDRTNAGKAKKNRILSKLPYEEDWLDTATANKIINQWVTNVPQQYSKTQLNQLRLNRNVRCHLHEYKDKNVEEILYCEWPELLMDMAKMLHMEGELEGTDIQNKFG